jgi:hypothetical protein
MKHTLSRVVLVAGTVACVLVLGAEVARAQETLTAPVGSRVAYALDTGVRGNEGDDWAVVFEKTITIPSTAWEWDSD